MAFNATYFSTPTVNDTRDMLSIFQFVSEASQGLFFPVMILVLWVIQFIGVLAEGRSGSRAFLFSSFTATILAIILGILALMAQKYVYLLVLMVSLGVFWVKLATAKE